MGTLIVHAGMPKVGSTSIQSWLAEAASLLQSDHGISIAVARLVRSKPPASADLRVRAYRGSKSTHRRRKQRGEISESEFVSRANEVHSGAFVRAYTRQRRRELGTDPAVLRVFLADLEELLSTRRTVVISCEGFATLLAADGGDSAFIAALEHLARRHEVRVAYYIRPQHAAIEAAWRQWGFRGCLQPTEWLAWKTDRYRHLATQRRMSTLAPNVSFEMVPCRPDLLEGGSLVKDFVSRFLGVPQLAGKVVDRRVNVGLPLEAAVALRSAPAAIVGRDTHSNREFQALQELLRGLSLSPDERVLRSRRVLHAYCFATFGEENRVLAAEQGWAGEPLVTAPPPGPWDIAELDALWNPSASRSELEILYWAIGRAMGMEVRT